MKGRIDTKMYDTAQLRASVDDYDSLSKQQKLDLARESSPVYEDTVYNVTTDLLHEYFVDNLDPDNTNTEANVAVSHLALGDDGTSGTATTDTDLNNRVYAEPVTDVADNGKSLLASTFIDSTEANGNTLDELGLFSGDPASSSNPEVFLMNHATFSPVTKDNSKTVTFDVTLQFADS
jgi:hypothetical protein